ncbi:hypothetical protein AAAC51_19145 [Priestia megaterium]
MKIKTKLFILLGVCLFIIIFLGSFSIKVYTENVERSNEIHKKTELLQTFKQIQYRLVGVSNDERAFFIEKNTSYFEQITDKKGEINNLLKELSPMTIKMMSKKTHRYRSTYTSLFFYQSKGITD